MKSKIFLSVVSLILGWSQVSPLLADEYEAETQTGTDITTEETENGRTTKVRSGKIKPYSEREVGKVSTSEVKQLTTRRQSQSFWSLGFGPSWTTNTSVGMAYSLSIGRFWDVHEHADLSLTLDGGFAETKADYGVALLGARYMLFAGDVTPYIGAGLGGGVIGGSDVSTSSGFAAGAFAGFRFFRTSDVNLDLGVKYLTVLGKKAGTPDFFGTTLSILF